MSFLLTLIVLIKKEKTILIHVLFYSLFRNIFIPSLYLPEMSGIKTVTSVPGWTINIDGENDGRDVKEKEVVC